MYIYTLYYSYLAIVLQKLCAWTSVEIWLCICNGSTAIVFIILRALIFPVKYAIALGTY